MSRHIRRHAGGSSAGLVAGCCQLTRLLLDNLIPDLQGEITDSIEFDPRQILGRTQR
jgi:hypothetical protein